MAGSQKPRSPAQLTSWIRLLIFRRRRLIAALMFCTAAGIAVQALLPHEEPRTTVVTATRDLPVGAVLDDELLTTVELPLNAVPSGAFTTAVNLTGQQLAAPLARGHVLTETSLVGPGLLAGTAAGTVAVPLRPADASTVQLLSPGQKVDVVLSTGNGFEVSTRSSTIARELPILWTSTGSSGSGAWPTSGEEEGLVVVAADPDDAAALAGASSSGQVHLVLTGS